jgi:hypothetical protein
LASLIKKRTTAGGDGLKEDSSMSSPSSRKKRNAEEQAAAVTAKVEDGNIKAAIRIYYVLRGEAGHGRKRHI